MMQLNPANSARRLGLPLLASWLVLLGACGAADAPGSPSAALPEQVTFSQHVAPILFQNCAQCHRAGEAAPFELLTYKDAKRRAKQIVYVTQERIMPPWLPEPNNAAFFDERRLAERDLRLLERWVQQGMQEGDPLDLPALPEWTEGWQLGEPDLVIELPEPYELQATGIDVFHTYVIPVPITSTKYVRAVEVRPENRRVVHHALMLNNTGEALRRMDAAYPGPGYPGTDLADALWPEGHMPGWLPGRRALPGRADIAWRLEPGNDAVLQLHMVPSGKPETVSPKIGFYWADEVPTRQATLLSLTRGDIDIPPGEKDYLVQDEFVLPVDVEVLTVQPHAHYLGTVLKGDARLPDGSLQSLIHIKQWDFNWQDIYAFAEPVFLPKGTTLSIDYLFDNSAENERNPSQPPQRVVHGWKTNNEMAELWLQILPSNPEEMPILKQAMVEDTAKDRLEEFISLGMGALRERAWDTKMQLQVAEAHNSLAQLFVRTGRQVDAEQHYRSAIAMWPKLAMAHNNLGLLFANQGKWAEALPHYEEALRVQPNLAKVHLNLALAQEYCAQPGEAQKHYERVVELQPKRAEFHNQLGAFHIRQGNREQALACLRRALELAPTLDSAHKNLARAHALPE